MISGNSVKFSNNFPFSGINWENLTKMQKVCLNEAVAAQLIVYL